MRRKVTDVDPVRLWDYLDGIFIDNTDFEGCRILGPAIILPMNNTTISDCTTAGTMATLIWEITDARESAIGVIGLRNCSIVRCTLESVAFAVPTNMIPTFWAGFGN